MIRPTLLGLARDRSRTTSMVLAVTLVVSLVVIPAAIRSAAISKPQNYLRFAGVDAIVMAPGVADYISQSLLSPSQVEQVQAALGSELVAPAVVGFATLKSDDEESSVVIQSYDSTADFGGPWSLAVGRGIERAGEVVIDESLGDQMSVHVGSSVQLGRGEFEVVGLSAETASIGKQLVFLDTEDVQRHVYDDTTLVTHLLVSAPDPVEFVDSVRATGLSAYTGTELLERNERYWTRQIGPTFDMMLLVVVVFGSLLMLTLFVMSNRARRRDLAVQSALGVPMRRLVAGEVLMAFCVTVGGAIVGVGFAWLGVAVVNRGSPGLEARLDAVLLARSMILVAAVVVVALVPNLVGLRRIDPADALAEPT